MSVQVSVAKVTPEKLKIGDNDNDEHDDEVYHEEAENDTTSGS